MTDKAKPATLADQTDKYAGQIVGQLRDRFPRCRVSLHFGKDRTPTFRLEFRMRGITCRLEHFAASLEYRTEPGIHALAESIGNDWQTHLSRITGQPLYVVDVGPNFGSSKADADLWARR